MKNSYFNAFLGGAIVILFGVVALVWYSDPEMITSWFKKSAMKGNLVWQAGSPPALVVYNLGGVEWKNVRIFLNKDSVSQRYETTVPAIRPNPQGFRITTNYFKKSNGEMYDPNLGEPYSVTVEAVLPDEQSGSLEKKLGGKKL